MSESDADKFFREHPEVQVFGSNVDAVNAAISPSSEQYAQIVQSQSLAQAQQYPSPQDQLHTGVDRRKSQRGNLERKVDYLINLVHNLGARVMAQDATIDDLITEVTSERDQVASVKTLIMGIRQQLNDALSGVNLPPAAQAKINEVLSDLQANSAAIADAIAAGGPPATTSVP